MDTTVGKFGGIAVAALANIYAMQTYNSRASRYGCVYDEGPWRKLFPCDCTRIDLEATVWVDESRTLCKKAFGFPGYHLHLTPDIRVSTSSNIRAVALPFPLPRPCPDPMPLPPSLRRQCPRRYKKKSGSQLSQPGRCLDIILPARRRVVASAAIARTGLVTMVRAAASSASGAAVTMARVVVLALDDYAVVIAVVAVDKQREELGRLSERY